MKPTDHRAKLAAIRNFDQLIVYLRDEMDWPIAPEPFEDVDDLFYDFTADELGIKADTAAKIQEIRRLRPLASTQPWGIFFIKFEPKQLPVIALRRILSQVALKKRASANSSERAAWAADDLLFISNLGGGEERRISFAHFSQPQDGHDLPTLKVLGWDNLDTALHLDAVARELTHQLAWPDDDSDIDAWRARWRGAFTLRHREVITTSKDLSVRLAVLARAIRDRITTALKIETTKGPLTRLMMAFKESLVHDLDEDGFADMYAQTIAYGLLSARIANPQKKTTDDFAAHMRTNPFLRELMETFLAVGGRRGKAGGAGIDFDELGVSEIVDLLDATNMEAVVRDFGDRNPQEDPVIHFYELFLKEYDARKRMQRGVFYTPRPVVSYIVRSVDELLRSEFGLVNGLADTTTWGEMAARNVGMEIPEGVSRDQDFVQILDPATGTGTFLVEVIDLIHRTLSAEWKSQGHGEERIDALWNEYVPKHLLTRLHGYELLMAPYAIAHLKVGLKLFETGYRFGSDERARVYLANALDPGQDYAGRFEYAIPALAHEAAAVNEVKRLKRFTVIIGNPPYSLLSANMEPHHRALIEAYKFTNGVRIYERGALQLEKNLNDDYVKFIRLSQLSIERAGVGASGLITNHSFLDNPTMRGVRSNLIESASQILLNDLHGNATKLEQPPDGGEDANVFQIKQGVAISFFVRKPNAHGTCVVKHHERWGPQIGKDAWLSSYHVGSHEWSSLDPTPDQYLFIPQDSSLKAEFEAWTSLQDMMPVSGAGYITARDKLVIDFGRDAVVERVSAFGASRLSDEALLKAFDVAAKKGWDVRRARAELRRIDIPTRVVKTNYRPFDSRFIFFDSTLVWGRSWPTMQHVLGHPKNLTMLATRMTKDQWDVWVSRAVSSHKAMSSYDTNSVFPLFLSDASEGPQRSLSQTPRINLAAPFLSALSSALGVAKVGPHGLPAGVTPEDAFHYAYAVFRSPEYRKRYADFLRAEFPRLPLTASLDMFRKLARLGGELVGLHLLESPKLTSAASDVVGAWKNGVDAITWSHDTVWIDKAQTTGFRRVPEDVWNFQVGGYQVCHKWLKDRKGRTLSKDDIAHYQTIIVAISETIRLMKEIDEVIEDRGGWPDAFQTNMTPGSQIESVDRADRQPAKRSPGNTTGDGRK